MPSCRPGLILREKPSYGRENCDALHVRRFPGLAAAEVLGSVQTALLSIGYNRGTGNRALEVLKQPIQDKDWAEVARLIGSMQQDHSLEGIRKRRRMEAELIKKELGGETVARQDPT